MNVLIVPLFLSVAFLLSFLQERVYGKYKPLNVFGCSKLFLECSRLLLWKYTFRVDNILLSYKRTNSPCQTYLLYECVKISLQIYLDIKKFIQYILCLKKKQTKNPTTFYILFSLNNTCNLKALIFTYKY